MTSRPPLSSEAYASDVPGVPPKRPEPAERRFSSELRRLLASCSDRALERRTKPSGSACPHGRPTATPPAGCELATLGEWVDALHGRGAAMLVLLFAAPFALPVPAFGLTVPFGLAIFTLGLRLSRGLPAWLPGRVRRRVMKPESMRRALRAALRVATWIERPLRPRLGFVFVRGLGPIIGLAIAACGLMLAFGPPVPMTNFIPALPAALLAAGLIERDGAAVLLGYVGTLLSFAFVALVCWLGVEGLRQLWTHALSAG